MGLVRLWRTSAISQAGGRRSSGEHDFVKLRKSIESSREVDKSIPFKAKTELMVEQYPLRADKEKSLSLHK